VTNNHELLERRAKLSVSYSHNFATAKPDIGATEKEHILGLCVLVTDLAAALSQPAGVVVSDEMIERACKDYALRVDGALWPDAYDEHEVLALRAQMREFLLNAIGAAPAASGGEFVTVPRELTPSMLEAAEQEEACGNDFPEMWEAAIATYIFDKENDNG
jgi:hypothetical protein